VVRKKAEKRRHIALVGLKRIVSKAPLIAQMRDPMLEEFDTGGHGRTVTAHWFQFVYA
jgi:hypothetical protein